MEEHLSVMERSIAQIKTTLDLILEKTTASRVAENELHVDENEWSRFPLENIDEIEDLKNRLRSDKSFKINLKKKLSVYGGGGATGSAKVLSKWLFQDNLLKHFSWAGTSEKHSFTYFKLSHPNYTAHANANFFKNYLKHAKFRLQTKNKSKKSKVAIGDAEPIIQP